MKRIFLLFFLFLRLFITAQEVVPVMNNHVEELLRIKQLTSDSGNLLSDHSFTVRPLTVEYPKAPNRLSIQLLPFQYLQQYNSRRPLYWNDGSLLPTRGWSFQYSGGVQADWKGLSIILRPEFNWALNPDFPAFSTDHFPIVWKYYYQWQNRIDAPEKYSGSPIRKLYAGQSRIQYGYKDIAVGVSTENLWWGPGRFNSLLMTNTAPGFLHATFHSDRPIHTKIGVFEWQVIAGRILPSNELPLEAMRSYDGEFLFNPKDSNGTRIITGGVLTWQPKWLKGFFIGMDAAEYRYNRSKLKASPMGSLFMRYMMPEEHAEIYFQYGRRDKLATPINVFQDTIPRGYLIGVRKLIALRKMNKNSPFIQLGFELTQLQSPSPSLIFRNSSWYTDVTVRHGYTHRGQVMGASIGPGSNSQRIDLAYVKNNLKIGLEFERWLHNTDFYYNLNVGSGALDFNRQWVDLMASLVWNIPIKKVMLFGQFSAIRAINYQWKAYIPEEGPVTNYFDNGWDFINYHVRSGVQVKL